MSDKKTAGGRATEAGMGFQAAVTAWFAAHLLAEMPIGILTAAIGAPFFLGMLLRQRGLVSL